LERNNQKEQEERFLQSFPSKRKTQKVQTLIPKKLGKNAKDPNF
jgi:type II secretory pathway component PulL